MKGLEGLPEAKVTLASRTEQKGPDEIEHVTVANPSSHLAFFVHLTVWKGKDGDDIRPIYWDDNYFELMPGEKREITGAFPKKLMGASKPVIKADGWNIQPVVY
jgi:exo-1,4-beta-D-glucosaminidase